MGAIVAAIGRASGPTSPAHRTSSWTASDDALHVAAAIALVGAVVAVATVRKVQRSRADAQAVAEIARERRRRPRLTAEERRAALLDTRLPRSSRRAATAARRRPRSRARPASPSRSSTATSRSKRDLYLAVRRRGLARGAGDVGGSVEDERDPARWVAAMGKALPRGEGPEARLAPTSGCRRSRRRARTRRSGATCASTCARCTTSSPTWSAARRRPAASVPDRDPDAEAWIFIALGLLGAVGRRARRRARATTFPRSSRRGAAGSTGPSDTPDISGTLDI